jgi:hypothetical protein
VSKISGFLDGACVQQWLLVSGSKTIFEIVELIKYNQEISGLPLPPDDTPAIEVLGPPKTEGFRCTFIAENEGGTSMCRFVGSDRRRIREDLKHEHGWDLGLKRGKASAVTNNGRDERP